MINRLTGLANGWAAAVAGAAGRGRAGRSARLRAIAGALALGGLMGLLLRHRSLRVPLQTTVIQRRPAAPAPRTPSEAALREAGASLTHAQLAVTAKWHRLLDWDPQALSNGRNEEETFRQELMAREHPSELRQARAAAQRAIALAQTPEDRFWAVVMLAWIEHCAGRHAEELRLARRLMRMAPHSQASLSVFDRAARCVARQQARRTDPSQ